MAINAGLSVSPFISNGLSTVSGKPYSPSLALVCKLLLIETSTLEGFSGPY